MRVELTTLSEKGQVVLPADVRTRLKFKAGDRFLVMGKDNTVILKKLEDVGLEKSFDEITRPIREKIERLGITAKDIKKEIEEYRKEKRRK